MIYRDYDNILPVIPYLLYKASIGVIGVIGVISARSRWVRRDRIGMHDRPVALVCQ